VAATAKLGADPLLVKDIIRSLERLETIVVSPMLIKEAIDCSLVNRLSFWDALTVVTAESAHCEILWTEDFNHGQVIRSILTEKPLK
jgi:predicted nucleic acid-binding protein